MNISAYLEWRGIDPEDACRRCGGAGIRAYPDTSTWRHGIGGMAITNDVCDLCWGSGSASKHWPSWRERLLSERNKIINKGEPSG